MIQEGKFSPSSQTFTPQQNSSKEISRKESGQGNVGFNLMLKMMRF
jgi:hypothetical protein